MKKVNVVSLFNGMGTLMQAFADMGVEVDKYYSSEIKPAAIKLQQHHFSEVVQVGDINNWKQWDIDWGKVDFIGSGSPCQDLSIAGKRKGITGSRSNLFFTFVEILEHVKKLNPNVIFLQENVGSANKKDIGIMSRALGVYPVRINSNLVTAQNRDRYYWTNIKTKRDGLFGDVYTDIPQPEDKGIMFKDIIENGEVDRDKSTCILEGYISKAHPESNQDGLKRRDKKGMCPIVYIKNKEVRVKTNTKQGYDMLTEDDCLNLAFPTSATRRSRVVKGKEPCLLEGNEPLYTLKDYTVRLLTKVELCRLQGFPDDFCDILTRNQAASLLGDGWTLPIIKHILTSWQ